MKRFLITAFALLFAAASFAQDKLPYSLPRTSLEFTVKAVRTDFTAGPYAAYAAKYLGIDVRTADETSYAISEVKLRSYSEADPTARYFWTVSKEARPTMLKLTSQGLVSNGNQPVKSDWKFPAASSHEFNVRPANLTSASGTGAMGREVVVEKSEEAKAAEVAKRIFAIRENKYNILVGDTDATYSGEAMKTAVDALDAMEAELLALFTGSTSTSEQQAVYEIIPSAGVRETVAFRLSQTEGLVAADDYSGTPWFVEIVPKELAAPSADEQPAAAKKSRKAQPAQMLHFRIPAICSVSLGDGVATILQQRIAVYQLGTEEVYPIY